MSVHSGSAASTVTAEARLSNTSNVSKISSEIADHAAVSHLPPPAKHVAVERLRHGKAVRKVNSAPCVRAAATAARRPARSGRFSAAHEVDSESQHCPSENDRRGRAAPAQQDAEAKPRERDSVSSGRVSSQRSTLSSRGAVAVRRAAQHSDHRTHPEHAEELERESESFEVVPHPAWGYATTLTDISFLTQNLQAMYRSGKPCCDEDFGIVIKVGQGAIGEVFIAAHERCRALVAMKRVHKATITARRKIGRAYMERAVCAAVQGAKFLCQAFCVYQTAESLVYCSRLYTGGTLYSYIHRNGPLAPRQAVYVGAQILSALEELHSRGFVHRDIKPENILIDAKGHVCLADFDLCERIAPQHCGEDEEDDGSGGVLCGTLEYLAPEMLQGVSFRSGTIDYWGLGVLLYEMMCLRTPWYSRRASKRDIVRRILRGRISFPRGVFPEDLENLIRLLLIRDHRSRICNPMVLKQHPVFNGIRWRSLHKGYGVLAVGKTMTPYAHAEPERPSVSAEDREAGDRLLESFTPWTLKNLKSVLKKRRGEHRDIRLGLEQGKFL